MGCHGSGCRQNHDGRHRPEVRADYVGILSCLGNHRTGSRREETQARAGYARPVAIADNTPDSCWKWGIIYYNPEDPALVVETRTGRSGCDLNFGNKWSWLVTAVILATPFVIHLLWF
jgi:uncharacterized membrane protein